MFINVITTPSFRILKDKSNIFFLKEITSFLKKEDKNFTNHRENSSIGVVITSAKTSTSATKIQIFCVQRNCGKGGLAQDSLNGRCVTGVPSC